jgi:hypothetical protein
MAAEALDIKTLTTLIMATPKTDIEQAVGRILRAKHTQPIVVDIVDNHDIFQNQYRKRKVFYVKNNYKIIKINSTTYNVPNNIGGPNDAYVYGTGNSFYIGNASENSISNTYIFTNGKNNDAVRIAVRADGTIGFHNFLPDYPVDILGTTRVQDGNFIVSNGQTNLGVVIEAQDNADAVLSGLTIGDVYRTGDFLKIVH